MVHGKYMNVAIVYNTAWYIYNFRRNLIKKLQEAGHTVVAISPYDNFVPKLEALGVQHHEIRLEGLSTNPVRELKSLYGLYKLLKKVEPDCVLSFTVKCNLYTGFCRRLLSFGHIANISGLGQTFDKKSLLRSLVCLMYRVGLKKSSAIFFQNKEDLNLCVCNNLVPERRCHLLPGSGVDLLFFSPDSLAFGEKRVFLMFGRLLPKKGYDDFLVAARGLKKKYGDAVEFRVMGVVDERRAESVELANRISMAESNGDIVVLPKTEDVRPVLKDCDVVVLPSTYNEGIPRSLLEALACGKPVITTDWKGCRETVVNGINGELIPIHNTQALADSLEKYVEMPLELLHLQGKASRRLAEKRFDEGLVIGTYMQQLAIAS